MLGPHFKILLSYSAKKYKNAIVVLDEGLRLDCETNSQLFFIINKGVEIFPANDDLWFNKGTCYETMDDIPKAIQAYQKVITISPLYRNAHLFLGNICYRQKLTTQALMCYNMALMVEPDSERAFALLKYLNEAISGKNENEANDDLTVSEDAAAFEDIDLILDTRIALSDKYPVHHDIDIALVKQSHAMLEPLEDFDGNSGFWDRRYVPIYK